MIINGTDLIMTRGDSETFTVKVTEREQGSKKETNLLVPGATLYFTVKAATSLSSQDAPIIERIITGFSDEEAIVKISPIDTKSLSYKPYVYDIELVKANGDVKTVVNRSKFVLDHEVTTRG